MSPCATLEDNRADATKNEELVDAAKKYRFLRSHEKEATPHEIRAAKDWFDNLWWLVIKLHNQFAALPVRGQASGEASVWSSRCGPQSVRYAALNLAQ
jgi:hypothetical protein